MSNNIRYWAIIPAAGISQRMGSDVPKQYLLLRDTMVIENSLECFLRHPKVVGVVVALHADDQHWNNLSITRNEKIHTVIGGKSRAESVSNAIQYLDDTAAEEQDFILVHDAARPCLRYSDLDLLIQKLEADEVGGILAAPVSDTLKLVREEAEGGNYVSETLDRSTVWRAFTPQMFRLKTLKKALTYCSKNSIHITDEASAVEALGLPVKLVEGQSDNIKITHAEDLDLAAAIVNKIKQ